MQNVENHMHETKEMLKGQNAGSLGHHKTISDISEGPKINID